MNDAPPVGAYVQLRYAALDADGKEKSIVDSFGLIRTRPNYGGERWWIRCDGTITKPKWMRWATFDRLIDEAQTWNDAAAEFHDRWP